jgi:hypothetical protein
MPIRMVQKKRRRKKKKTRGRDFRLLRTLAARFRAVIYRTADKEGGSANVGDCINFMRIIMNRDSKEATEYLAGLIAWYVRHKDVSENKLTWTQVVVIGEADFIEVARAFYNRNKCGFAELKLTGESDQ